MKKGWVAEPVGELCTFYNGLWTGKKPPFVTAGVFRNTNFGIDGELKDNELAILEVEERQLAKRRLQYGDIILEKSGGGPKQAVGRVAFYNKTEGVHSFSNFTAAIRVKDKTRLLPQYLLKFLSWTYQSGVTEGMQSHSTGIRNLNGDAYKAIGIPLPPPDEQRRIVAVLDKAFAGITTAMANAQKNLTDARTLFESYLESELSGLSNLGPNVQIGSEVDFSFGFAFKSNGYTSDPDGIRLLRGDNIVNGKLRWDGVVRWPQSEAKAYRAFEMQAGDVVLAMDRTWVKSGLKFAVIKEEDLPLLQVQRVARMRCRPSISHRFLSYHIESPIFTKYIIGIQTGLGVPHISGKQIAAFRFIKPSLLDQKKLIDRLDRTKARVVSLEETYQNKLAALSELKHSLLHKAFAGELT